MKLVLIEWVDSHIGGRWNPLQDIKQDGNLVHCRSVGWLLQECKEYKVIVPHLSGEKDEDMMSCGNGNASIPTKAIIKMEVLRAK